MYKRIIVKVGTGVLSKADGAIDQSVLKHLVEQISTLKKGGVEVILVTSGAVGTGKRILAQKDSSYIPQKQMFAAIGQVELMATYARFFARLGYICAQVLATKEDFRDKVHYANMKNCFERLLHASVVPVVNENDVVAIAELVFTDNDELAGLVAAQLKANAVIILTGVDGVLADEKVIPIIDNKNTASVKKHITPEKSAGGRGGMHTKFDIAKRLSRQGIVTHIVNGKKRNILLQVMAGKQVGTKFLSRKSS
jgi:glutamate 5-kinase